MPVNVMNTVRKEQYDGRKDNWAIYVFFFFFFEQKTTYEISECDWSSVVCSSDLAQVQTFSKAAWAEVRTLRAF